jgi:transcriptional regulator with XRE-family HTH domain
VSDRRRLTARSLDGGVRDTVTDERIDALRGPDGPEGRALAAVVADNLVAHRIRRGLALEVLAERTGIRPALLARIEAGQTVPSLRALWTLAVALEVPFGALLAHPDGTCTTFRVQRAGHGRVFASSSGKFRSRSLSPLGDPYAPELYELTLGPGCFEPAAAHGLRTYEHLAVVRGLLVLQVDEQLARLGPGDSVSFRADRPHSYRNPTSSDAVAHLVMTYA